MNTRTRKFQILCIEDNEANMLVVERIAESQSFDLIKAYTAEEGIALARKSRPDVILMDMHLPGMDGLEATQLLKGEEDLQNIPVIAVTASSVYDRKRCTLAGC